MASVALAGEDGNSDETRYNRKKTVKLGSDAEEVIIYAQPTFEQDVYGFTIKALIKDIYMITCGADHRFAHTARLVTAYFILICNIVIQMSLMYFTRVFISMKQVKDTREVYSHYQKVMYNNGASDTLIAANFDTFTAEEKEGICQISLSQPMFVFLAIFIWTLLLTGEVRGCVSNLHQVLGVPYPSGPHKKQYVTLLEDGSDDGDGRSIQVSALSRCVKCIVILTVTVPRLIVTFCLWWLGSRWLLATNKFSDLLLNAVALAFIKDIKDLLYNTLVSNASKREMELTHIHLPAPSERVQMWTYMAALPWGIAACLLTVLYIFLFQQVLPDYKFDVHKVCEQYIVDNFQY